MMNLKKIGPRRSLEVLSGLVCRRLIYINGIYTSLYRNIPSDLPARFAEI